MPYIIYEGYDAEFHDTYFGIDSTLDEAIAKVLYADFNNYGFKDLLTTADAPLDLDTLTTKGNWCITHYTNGPESLLNPINIHVTADDTKEYQIIFYMLDFIYREREIGTETWSEWTNIQNKGCNVYCGEVEPTIPETEPFAIWINTELKDFPVIYGYNHESGFFGMGSLNDILSTLIYDSQNRHTDIFLYFEEKFGIPSNKNGNNFISYDDVEISDVVTFYNLRYKFMSHFKMGHLTDEEREMFNNMISVEEVQEYLDEAKAVILAYLEEKVALADITILNEILVADRTDVDTHRFNMDIHISEEENAYYHSKAEPDHEHNLDGRVILKASDILEGVFSMDVIPDSAKHTLIRVLTHEARFALTSDRVQKGDSVYVSEETEEYDEGLYLVYDDTKLDSDDGWIFYRVRRIANIDFEDVERKPTTLEGYGITNAVKVVKDAETDKFIFPYTTNDSTLNYLLNVATNDFYDHMMDVLDVVEAAMSTDEAKDIWSAARVMLANYNSLYAIWEPYRLIDLVVVHERHELNKEEIIALNERLDTLTELIRGTV